MHHSVQAPAPASKVASAAQNVPSGQPAGAQASSSSNVGPIVGGVVGGVAIIALAGLVAVCLVVRRHRRAHAEQKLSHYHEYNGKDGVLALDVSLLPPAVVSD